MSPSLQVRSVHLRVSNLERSLKFYRDQLGFALLGADQSGASLSTSKETPPLLTLTEDASARRAPSDAAGLFHAALLLPSRSALGSWLRTTADAGVKFDGFSDHGVSEAIYLSDPDGNGLEFYADRPRAAWPFRDGHVAMMTETLALPDLLAAGAAFSGPPLADAGWGHLHLKVTSLDRSQQFYTSTLGVQLMQNFGDSARFLAADGYHHHLGLNRWGGVSQPQPANSLGLIAATFERVGANQEKLLVDPDEIAVRVLPGKEK